MILVQSPLICLTPDVHRPLICITSPAKSKKQLLKSKFFGTRATFKCGCIKNDNTEKPSEGFSVLKSDIPCDNGNIWSTMALYLFSLHIPLSFGGLSVVAQILHQPVLDPQIEALSLLVIQTLEFIGILLLLRVTEKPQYTRFSFFQANKLSRERNWLLASAFGFGFLVFLVFLTSLLADRLIGPKNKSGI